MAPANKKATNGNSEIRKRKKGGEEADDDDRALLEAGTSGSWTDSFIVMRASIWAIRSIVALTKGKPKEPEAKNGDAAKHKKADETPPSAFSSKEAFKEAAFEKIKQNKIPFFLSVVGFLTCLLIISGEGFDSGREDRAVSVNEDYYGTLGVTRDAENADVKRAYKTLARRWHPDKNPNCTTCQETFSKIADAYETLSDDKKRAAYDESGGVATAELKSPRSVPLTRDNFDQLVTYSNDVWIVQIFKPEDGSCAQFHPFWESQIQKYGHLVRFGRVDVTSDLGKWLPVKFRVLPTVLKFRRDLGSPEIFPITAMHETPQMLMKFVLTSFPNIGLPLHSDPGALSRWATSAGRRHKVLLAIPGKSEEERYKSHLVPRKLANRWSELFEFRTAETSSLHKLSNDNLPAEIREVLPSEKDANSKGAMVFFAANGGAAVKVHKTFSWPITEDELVLQLLDLAELAAPALTSRSADLLCRSLAIRRVYCLVLLDPPDSAVKRAMGELKDSREAYGNEVKEIRASGGEVTEDEDNFIVPAVRLFRRQRGLQPSVATCAAPKFVQVEKALAGSNALLMDLDTGRIAALKGLSSFRGIYPQIAYEDSLSWIDDTLHPFLSLPDCDEGLVEHTKRSLKAAPMWELLIALMTAIFLVEAVAKAVTDSSAKWGAGAGALLILMLLRSPPFLRRVTDYLPGAILAPSLLGMS